MDDIECSLENQEETSKPTFDCEGPRDSVDDVCPLRVFLSLKRMIRSQEHRENQMFVALSTA